MIPTDNKCPKVKELIEELQRFDPDDRVRIKADISQSSEFTADVPNEFAIGTGPMMIGRVTEQSIHGQKTYVELSQYA